MEEIIYICRTMAKAVHKVLLALFRPIQRLPLKFHYFCGKGFAWLARVVARILSGSASGPVRTVPFGSAVAVSIGDACLCTLSPAPDGVDIEWAPHSSEARAMLAPLLAAMIS